MKKTSLRTETKPTRESEARMAFFVTNLSLLALRLGEAPPPPPPPPRATLMNIPCTEVSTYHKLYTLN